MFEPPRLSTMATIGFKCRDFGYFNLGFTWYFDYFDVFCLCFQKGNFKTSKGFNTRHAVLFAVLWAAQAAFKDQCTFAARGDRFVVCFFVSMVMFMVFPFGFLPRISSGFFYKSDLGTWWFFKKRTPDEVAAFSEDLQQNIFSPPKSVHQESRIGSPTRYEWLWA